MYLANITDLSYVYHDYDYDSENDKVQFKGTAWSQIKKISKI